MDTFHLGEDLYASTDGYHIWIGKSTSISGTFMRIVALEPSVYFALWSYTKRAGLDVGSSEPTEPTYLGDGVYAEYTQSVVTLSVGSHLAPKAVYITKEIFENLQKYVDYLEELAKIKSNLY